MGLSVEDKAAIIELCGRYSQAYDYDDADAYAETFTEDGSIEFNGGETTQGREALKAFVVSSNKRGTHFRHHTSGHVVEGDGEVARHHCNVLATWVQGGKATVWGTGSYDDQLKKVGGQWRFAHRAVTVDG